MGETITVVNRKDTLPEGASFCDTGCSLHPTCLGNGEYPECPLPYCRYDDPAQERVGRTFERWQQITELRFSGLSAPAIAKAAHCSTRTVHRVMAEGLGAAAPDVPEGSPRYADTRAQVDALQNWRPLVRLYHPPRLLAPGRGSV